ncbi:hypothetical protein [Bifidobacterium aquikefiricola]|uniref:ABC transporter permease n=1 Tax=Bifidobacterium aquikefiricola TaxID=3059038 RepID=A0AB39U6D8_9BIFI
MSGMKRYPDAMDHGSRSAKGATNRRFRGFGSLQLGSVALLLIASGLLSSSIMVPTLGNLEKSPVGALTLALVLEVMSWCALPMIAWMLVAWLRSVNGLADAQPAAARRAKLIGLILTTVVAVVSEVPYDLANSGKVWDFDSQNPACALPISLLVLVILEAIASPSNHTLSTAQTMMVRVVIVGAGLAWMWLLNVDVRLGIMQGGVLFLLYCLVFHFLARHENTMMLLATLVGLVGFMIPSLGLLAVHFRRNEQEAENSRNRLYIYLLAAYALILVVFVLARWVH